MEYITQITKDMDIESYQNLKELSFVREATGELRPTNRESKTKKKNVSSNEDIYVWFSNDFGAVTCVYKI